MTTALLLKVMSGQCLSPDLNLIEHMWGILKQKVEKHHVSNIQQLRDVIMEEWMRMPATTCAALVNSMPWKIKAVLIMMPLYKIDTLDSFEMFTRVYSFLLPIIWTIMVICWVIFRGHLYFYTSCTLTTLKYIQVSFVQYCPLRNYTKFFAEMWGVYSLWWDTVYIYIYIYTHILVKVTY